MKSPFTPAWKTGPVHFLYRPDSFPELAVNGVEMHLWDMGFEMVSDRQQQEEEVMPLIDIQVIEGVFDKSQKQEMIRKVTDAMVSVEGEAMRGVTWVRVQEVASGEWAIGGKGLTTADVKAMAEH